MDEGVDLQELAEEVSQLMLGRRQSAVERTVELFRQHGYYPLIEAPNGNEPWRMPYPPRLIVRGSHWAVMWDLAQIEKASEEGIREMLLELMYCGPGKKNEGINGKKTG